MSNIIDVNKKNNSPPKYGTLDIMRIGYTYRMWNSQKLIMAFKLKADYSR